MAESDVLENLAERVWQPTTRRFLEQIALSLGRELQDSPGEKSRQMALPLGIYGDGLPADVKSSWVFLLRKETEFLAERHPNSIQRMFALDREGAVEVWATGWWRSHKLSVLADDPGLSIPTMAWHRPARLPHDWAVVSFHTVPAADLIEELGDPGAGRILSQRHYAPHSPN